MTNSVTVSAPATGAVGVALAVSGTVSPSSDSVQVQLASQNTTLPTGPWFGTTTSSGAFAGTVTPVGPGTWYVWAYDAVTGVSGVSGAVVVPQAVGSTVTAVPIPTAQAASLLGGSAAGETPDQLTAAAAAADTDTAIVAQGGKTLFAQPFLAIWNYIVGKLAQYLLPVKVLSASTALDTSDHSGRLLQVTATGVTISVNTGSMSAGFNAWLVNDSSGVVTFSGINLVAGGTTLAAGGAVFIFARVIGSTLTLTAR